MLLQFTTWTLIEGMPHVTLTKGYASFEVNSYGECGRRLDIANAIKILIFFKTQKEEKTNNRGRLSDMGANSSNTLAMCKCRR